MHWFEPHSGHTYASEFTPSSKCVRVLFRTARSSILSRSICASSVAKSVTGIVTTSSADVSPRTTLAASFTFLLKFATSSLARVRYARPTPPCAIYNARSSFAPWSHSGVASPSAPANKMTTLDRVVSSSAVVVVVVASGDVSSTHSRGVGDDGDGDDDVIASARARARRRRRALARATVACGAHRHLTSLDRAR